MIDCIDRLLSHESASTRSPADPAAIKAIAEALGDPVPGPLLALWRRSDGIELTSLNAEILSTGETLDLLSESCWLGLPRRGLLPFFDDHESNLLTVSTRGPLAPRVVYVPHDDGSRLMFRDIESCFGALWAHARAGEEACTILSDAHGDYAPDGPRTVADQAAATALLAQPHTLDEWNHAVQLLHEDNTDQWQRLLETDHFIRRDARARMRAMSSRSIQSLLEADRRAFEAFVREVIEAAARAGFRPGSRKHEMVEFQGCWLNMDVHFHRRNVPQAIPRLIVWISDSIAGRDPRQRPGHYHSDAE
jgi:hypothetical protein